MDDHVVGVLGGGQLGRMLVDAANDLNIKVAVLDAEGAPAKQNNAISADRHVTGSFAKAEDVRKFSKQCDVLTFEIEHVDTKVLEELEEEQSTLPDSNWSRIQPSWKTIRLIQDKFTQKQHLIRHGIPVADSRALGTSHPQELKEIADSLQYPLMLKSRTEAYDGRGNYPVRSVSDIEHALAALSNRPLYAERWADFKMELAVIVVKTTQQSFESATTTSDKESNSHEPWASSILAYPTTETIHEDSICKLTYTPARNVSKAIRGQAQLLARRTVATFQGTGVFGVEMFLLQDDSLVVNEIAPRPHNSGHYTIEACGMSQYEAHIRAVLPDPADTITPGSTELLTKNTHAIMLNILGGPHAKSHLIAARAALRVPGARVHLYGKGAGRPGRKMGHITLVSSTMEECQRKIAPLIHYVDSIRAHRSHSSNDESVTTSSIISTANAAITHDQQRLSNMSAKPLIGVCMGSDTDLATLKPGLTLLDDLAIPYEVSITSAHRTPQFMLDYASTAASRGLLVILAAAGGAAHLPGMLASHTPLPVVGVPVKASALDGLDSLCSIVQMPRGIPVGTVGIGNSVNGALLAARIVGVADRGVRENVEKHLKDMEEENLGKNERLKKEGWKGYVKVDGVVERGSK